jgi:hypothetical protein
MVVIDVDHHPAKPAVCFIYALLAAPKYLMLVGVAIYLTMEADTLGYSFPETREMISFYGISDEVPYKDIIIVP